MRNQLKLLAAILFCWAMPTAAQPMNSVSYGPGSFSFIAPRTDVYRFTVQGGRGGDAFENDGPAAGGYAAVATGWFSLDAGDALTIEVGPSGTMLGTLGSGGGGSFVYLTSSNTLLLAAGGGGGATTVANPSLDSANGGDADINSSALVVSGGDVAGVDGADGRCCGGSSGPGAGGLSYVNVSPGDGYDSNAGIALAVSGGAGSITILFAAPEPGSWAMMILGFAIAGCAVRRRRASALLDAADTAP